MQLESLKNDIKMVEELGEMATVLEQVAAREIAKIKGRIIDGRPFFDQAWQIYRTMKQVAPLSPEVVKQDLVVVITLNWGMFGGLLNKVMDRAEQAYQQYNADMLITGKLGQSRFSHKNERTVHFFEVPNHVNYEDIEPLKSIMAKYAQVHFVFPRYIKASKQEVEMVSLIVGQLNKKPDKSKSSKQQVATAQQYLLEPDPQQVANYLNKTIVGILVYSYFQESLLAYNASQMLSMRNAHDNAKEEKDKLLQRYHKARREQIDAKIREQQEVKFSRKMAR